MTRFLGLSALFPAVFAASAAGCAVAPLPARTAELPLEAWERMAAPAPTLEPAKAAGDAAVPDELAKSEPVAPKPAATPAETTLTSTAGPPGGDACLEQLGERGVSFARSEPVLGVATPVVVSGAIGGVSFYSHERKPLVMDCRLALALVGVTEELRALGVTKARYSGAYVYRTSHPGRLSMHAYGLAIDLHSFTFGTRTLEVKQSFSRGQGSACKKGMPELNLVACRVRRLGLFKEQLGPDDNAAHRDHFHLGLKPLPQEVAADLPWPAAPARSKRRAAR
ncbi:MAG TPA: extensin family protein [Polyangiaceae bacterium]